MKKSLLLFTGFLFALWTFCQAQNNPIIPGYLGASGDGPSAGNNINTSNPQVWGVMKYGGDIPNLYTGTVSTSIPIYTYKDEDFTLPIFLSYASNGYMPNITANDVGLGWILNTGGYITRTIRGIPDDYKADPQKAGDYSGYLFSVYDYTNVTELSENYINPGNRDVYTYKNVETEPDIYTFNFLGHSGRFTMAGKKIVVFDTTGPCGEYSVEFYNPSVDHTKNITIVTGDGYRYKFIEKIESAYLGNITADGGVNMFPIGNISPSTRTAASADRLPEKWYLATITAPNGRTITYNYGDDLSGSGSTLYVESCRFGGSVSIVDGINTGRLVKEERRDYFRYKEQIAQLKSIDIDGGTNIRFGYTDREPERDGFFHDKALSYTKLDTPQKLDTITVTHYDDVSKTRTRITKCYLKYTYGVSKLNSLGRWDGNPVLLLTTVKILGVGSYNMEYYDQDQVFSYQGTDRIDHWGYSNYIGIFSSSGTVATLINPMCYNFTERVVDPTGGRNPKPEYAMQGMLSKLTYPTGGYTTFEYESHMFRDYIARDRSAGSRNFPYLKPYPKDTIAGGVRIRKITDYPLEGNSVSRSYIYKNADGKSSGNLLSIPVYSYYITRETKGCAPFSGKLTCIMRGYNTSGITGYRTDQTHIEYETVTEKYSDGSYVTYKFSNYHNAPDKFRSRREILQHPNCRMAVYDYTLNSDLARHDDLPELVNNYLTAPDFEPQYRGKLLSASNYSASGALTKEVVYEYDTLKTRRFVESVKLAGDFFYIHRTYIESYPLKRVKTTEYNGQNPFRMEYTYEYNPLGQLTYTCRTDSDGRETVSRTKYVSDLSAAQQAAGVYAKMIAKNFLSLPIKTWKAITNGYISPERPESGKKELRIAENQYEYTAVTSNIVCLSALKVARIAAPQEITTQPAFDTSVACQYDNRGRLVQTVDRTGLTTSFVWGYNGLHLLAQVVGAEYSTVKSAVGTLSSASTYSLSSDQEQELRRLAGTLVTTYSYCPYGISGVTDPAGRRKNWGYDMFGRLEAETYFDIPIRTYGYSNANN